MDKVFREKDLCPITHKEFNELIKGKGFKGQNNYRLRDLKAMSGFKPMITGSPVTISSDGTERMRFDSLSKASTSTGMPLTFQHSYNQYQSLTKFQFTLKIKSHQLYHMNTLALLAANYFTFHKPFQIRMFLNFSLIHKLASVTNPSLATNHMAMLSLEI